jgi:hypothetical protein
MTFRIRQIDQTSAGREIVRERAVDKPHLSIGRAAENDIHLGDLALDPHHAEITLSGEGRIAIKALGTLGFTLDGASRHAAEIICREGCELRFGGHRVTVSEEQNVPVLTVSKLADAQDHVDDARAFSIASVLPGRRRTGWIAALLILGLFLVLPIATHMLRGPSPGGKVIGDSSWSPGKLSRGHHRLESRCEACHVQGFVAVRDETCRSCHQQVHNHASTASLAAARGSPTLGRAFLQGVSSLFNRPGSGACTDCHVEHEGAHDMPPPKQAFCADCHAALKDHLPASRLGNAADFGTLHPEFAPLVVTNAETRQTSRVPLDQHPREDNGLTFPHRLHLNPLGGAARMAVSLGNAAGYGRPLNCANCHHSSEDGARFKPIEMERDCGACHSLAYDKLGGTVRTLRHGDVAQALADLSTWREAVPLTGRQRPGAFASGGVYHANFTAPVPVPLQAFSRDGLCGSCHTAEMRGGRLSVRPVTLKQRFMDHGWFDHRAHRQTRCLTCHAADKSNSSSDLLLPRIATCRTCHAGEGSTAKNKVPSTCADCHSYHAPSMLSGERRQKARRDEGD